MTNRNKPGRVTDDQLLTIIGITLIAIITLINCELAARCFDEPNQETELIIALG